MGALEDAEQAEGSKPGEMTERSHSRVDRGLAVDTRRMTDGDADQGGAGGKAEPDGAKGVGRWSAEDGL